jgi:Mg-chelatase subunit ChlI
MSNRPIVYPFTAIVGQDEMKLALVLNAIDMRIGGVLIRGERGTGKSTAARALAALLPEIQVIADSPFNDDPRRPASWSDVTQERYGQSDDIPVETRRISFIDLPVSATEDRVVGTLDIEKAIQQGEKHFEPGVLASANRGVLYIDEVNLLDDHIVDLLLDSAAMGRNVVEREGISFSHPARFILVGTMNPEEGDLRPQLLDRFALSVNVEGIHTQQERIRILERHIRFEDDPDDFMDEWNTHEQSEAERIMTARGILDKVDDRNPNVLTYITKITSKAQIDGHRADLVILKAARAHAAYQGRKNILMQDVDAVADMALRHRRKGGPFAAQQADLESIKQQAKDEMDQEGDGEEQETGEEGQTSEQQTRSKKKVSR